MAYSLLSQITHSTPIGHLHTVRFRDGIWHGNELTPEVLGLALDTACLGSAHLIGLSAVILTNMSSEAFQYREISCGKPRWCMTRHGWCMASTRRTWPATLASSMAGCRGSPPGHISPSRSKGVQSE